MRTAERVKSTAPLILTGYDAWVKDFLTNIPLMDSLDPSYSSALALIAARREEMRKADIKGPGGKTAGWSPSGNFKLDGEFPFAAALLLKAAFGPDALTNKRKRHAILKLHPEFSYTSLSR